MCSQFPFQFIRCVEAGAAADHKQETSRFLVVAAGSCLGVYDARTGARKSVWTTAVADAAKRKKEQEEEYGKGVGRKTGGQDATEESGSRVTPENGAPSVNSSAEGRVGQASEDDGDDTAGPPEKRRKLSFSSPHDKDATEAGKKDTQGVKPRSADDGALSPALSIVLLAASPRIKNYVVVATGEDKCVRTLRIDGCGQVSHMSERHLPKRPSAIILVNNNDNDNDDDNNNNISIIVADKFGDVYSLPLHYDKDVDSLEASKADIAPKPKKTKPAADNLTVHTQRNLKVLQQQLRETESRAAATEQAVKKAFPLTLLLGHVSLLTDLALVTLPRQEAQDGQNGQDGGHHSRRSYLITADRDEHIRVSRGPPQTHVIEGFCLGHRSFVNRICAPAWDCETLVSGGGDDFILVWDWLSGSVRQQIPLDLTVLGKKTTPPLPSAESDSAPAPAPAPTPTPTVAEAEAEAEAEDATPEANLNNSNNHGKSLITVSGIWDISFEANQDALRHQIPGAILVAVEGSPVILVYTMMANEHTLVPQQQPLILPGNVLSLAKLEGDGTGKIAISVDTFFAPGSTTDTPAPASGEQQTNKLPFLQTFAPVFSDDGALQFQAVKGCQIAKAINDSAITTPISPATERSGETVVDKNKMSETLYGASNLRKSEKHS